MASSSCSCHRRCSSAPCRPSRCRCCAPRCCCRGPSLRGARRPRAAAQRPAARKCLACACGGAQGSEDVQRAAELSRKSARALSHSLLRAGGRHPEGFEDDPITYVHVGWTGGCLPPTMEAEISGRLCSIFSEDVTRLLREDERKRSEQSQQAVKRWLQKKQAEALLRKEHSPVAFAKAHLHLKEDERAKRPAPRR